MTETKIKILRPTVEEVEVAVEFPLYLRGDDYPDDFSYERMVYYRIAADGRRLMVSVKRPRCSDTEYSIALDPVNLAAALDGYMSDSFTYQRITPQEFEAAMEEAMLAMGYAD